MPRKSFSKKIECLNQKILEMGNEIDDRLEQTILVLKDKSLEIAKEVAQGDNQVDSTEHQIERFCMNLLALEQPMASDLRLITSCLKIITDMERIGDQCEDICEIVIEDSINFGSREVRHVVKMMENVREMFKQAMEVFVNRDVEEAIALCKRDDEIDDAFKNIILEISEVIKGDKSNIMNEIATMFITKYIERIGDHITNIAEWVIYLQTGEHPELN